MRGRTLAVCRSIKLGAVLLATLCVFTADGLGTALHDQSATPDEYSACSNPADLRAGTSETGLLGTGSEALMPSRGTVWLADSFSLEAFCAGHASTESS